MGCGGSKPETAEEKYKDRARDEASTSGAGASGVGESEEVIPGIPPKSPIKSALELNSAVSLVQAWWIAMREGHSLRRHMSLRQVFNLLDADKSGALDHDELIDALTLMGDCKLSVDEAEAIFKAGDMDGDGTIDPEEFVAMVEGKFVTLEGDTLRKIAKVCHRNIAVLCVDNGLLKVDHNKPLEAGIALKVGLLRDIGESTAAHDPEAPSEDDSGVMDPRGARRFPGE